jgi:hypothetical protein
MDLVDRMIAPLRQRQLQANPGEAIASQTGEDTSGGYG